MMHLTIPLHVSALTLLVQSEKNKVLVIQRSHGQGVLLLVILFIRQLKVY